VFFALAPADALATHWVVDQSGAGDFATIQEALDSYWNGLGRRESVLVMPGAYPESLVLNNAGPNALIGV
jgi:pectin methylesterase-like acyl-CoA thioesterase